MKRLIILIGVFYLLSPQLVSQPGRKDSLYDGRPCKLILYNGYEATGNVVRKQNDTIFFKTEVVTLKVPLSEIKFVLDPDADLPESGVEDDSKTVQIITRTEIDTSDECDLYLDDRTVMNDVELVYLNDSTLQSIKQGIPKPVKISGVRKIVFKPIAPFGRGYIIGSAIGFAAGFFSLAFARGHGEQWGGPGVGLVFGFLLSVPAGLLGGVVGVISSSEDIYLFESGTNTAKSKRLKYIVEKHRK
jgi:hypothetical protein